MDLDPRTEDQIRHLADPANRAVLAAVREVDQPLEVSELAERLVDDRITVVSTAEYEQDVEDAVLALHHDRLPRLAEAELIEYDPDANVVTEAEARPFGGDWHDPGSLDELVSQFRTGDGADEDGVRAIEGRESILRYGRRLVDGAEEELFCMYLSTDMLEDECIRCLGDAIERGVTTYVGSQNSAVLDLTRRELPEATVWEPQLDLLNAPTYPRVGRLILADRRTVMLAILGEPGRDGEYPEETAVAGDGEDHPLVVLVRELLGSRLDHLDYQSEAFRTELPK